MGENRILKRFSHFSSAYRPNYWTGRVCETSISEMTWYAVARSASIIGFKQSNSTATQRSIISTKSGWETKDKRRRLKHDAHQLKFDILISVKLNNMACRLENGRLPLASAVPCLMFWVWTSRFLNVYSRFCKVLPGKCTLYKLFETR